MARRVALLLLGGWVSVAGMLVHRHVLVAGGVTWPWGLALALTATWLLVHEASKVQRIGGAWFALGWTGALMLERLLGGTSYLVTTDWLGWSFMLGGIGLAGFDVIRGSRVNA